MAKQNRIRFGDAFRKKTPSEENNNNVNDIPEQDEPEAIVPDLDEKPIDPQPAPMSQKELYSSLGIKSVDLVEYPVEDSAVTLITADIAKKYKAIPIAFDKTNMRNLLVAMADPMDVLAIDDISIITNFNVVPLAAAETQIAIIIDKYFGEQAAKTVAEEYKREFAATDQETEEIAVSDAVSDAPIVQLVRGMIEQAVHRRASDIHIEPLEHYVRLRYRIDGSLVEMMKYDLSLLPVIISRIKIISGLDISEKRIPQDGRSSANVNGDQYDIRVSTLPTVYGEKIVMRLNAQNTMKLDKRRLGLEGKALKDFDGMLAHPHGILLVSGPTGSGKTTTLYTALNELNTEDVNIITVEDPVEVNIAGVNQIQVNEKAGLTFASALRSILRQDPDIIMIGEIRDGETAGIAVQAAITGHLVVSTIHTNSTSATVARLIDMGVEPFLAADSLIGIIAQRLARRLCECKEAYEADEFEKKKLGLPVDEPYTIYRPVGCPKCSNTGYFGRIGVYETLNMTSRIRMLISSKATSDQILQASLEQGMQTLYAGMADLVRRGITSVYEMRKAEAAE